MSNTVQCGSKGREVPVQARRGCLCPSSLLSNERCCVWGCRGPGPALGSARGRRSAGGRCPRGARRDGGGAMAAAGPERPGPTALALLGPAPGAPCCPHGEPGPGLTLPSVTVLGSRRGLICNSPCEGLVLEARLLQRSRETGLRVFSVLSYRRVCP